MATDEAALVLVLPSDDMQAVIKKIRATPTTEVEVLVPEGVNMFHDPKQWEQLSRSIKLHEKELLVFSSDERTLDAARESHLQTVGITGGGRLVAPDTMPPPASPYTTSRLPEIGASAGQISGSDEQFLQSLDSMPATESAQERAADEDDWMAEFDNLSDVMQAADAQRDQPQQGGGDYDAFAAELDDLSASFDMGDMGGAEERAAPAAGQAPPAAQPRPRIRPEDIELTDEEKQRASTTGTGKPPRSRGKPASTASRQLRQMQEEQAEEEMGPVQTRSPLRTILLVAVVIVLLIVAFFVLFRDSFPGASTEGLLGALPFLESSATITVILPPAPTEVQAIIDQPVAIAPPGSESSDYAMQAAQIWATITYTETGQVTEETLSPAGSARGIITLYNQNTQAVSFPQGTEFVALNAQGSEVYFTSDEAISLAGSSTSRQGAQIITTLGQAQATVTARTPGSASNVPAGSITQIIVPGQGTIFANAGSILLEHGPLTGGDEQPIRIVKDTNVQEILGSALTGLNNRARQVLEERAAQSGGLVLEVTTITPNSDTLGQGAGYEQRVIPPVGETVDIENPTFSVVVSGRFSALATPQGRSLQEQLQAVLPNQLASEERLPQGMKTDITGWEWNGSRLTVDGLLQPTGEVLALDEQTVTQIRDAIRGKSRSEAEAALNEFVAQGIISGYTLPGDMQTLPNTIAINSIPARD